MRVHRTVVRKIAEVFVQRVLRPATPQICPWIECYLIRRRGRTGGVTMKRERQIRRSRWIEAKKPIEIRHVSREVLRVVNSRVRHRSAETLDSKIGDIAACVISAGHRKSFGAAIQS